MGKKSSFLIHLRRFNRRGKLIKIKQLTELNLSDFQKLVTGYTSTAKYVVTKQEGEAQTQITLTKDKLSQPYIKEWARDQPLEAHYLEVFKQGLSVKAVENGDIVGMAICDNRAWNRTLWVWEFHVHPERQGEGIGRQLMEAVIENARRAGCRVIVCETQNTNAPAVDFYRKLGFEIGGVDLSYYTNEDVTAGEVAIFMKYKIRPGRF